MCHICAQPDGAELVDIKESAARGDCLCCSVTAEALGKIIPEEESVNIKRSLESAFARVSIDGPGEYLYRDAGFCLDIFTNETKNTPAWISKQRVPSGDTSSDAALDWAKVWLDYCQREHEKCQLGEGLSFPTRIIEVTPFNERGDVRLIDQACRLPFDRYIALSHCWGKTLPSCRTLTTTLNQHITNIPFDNLPKTYQDAILFTRKLGIRWIWIDSICIVQDDISDWRHEAGKMSEVYGNSFVTLAAVHSWDSHGGLFSEVSQFYNDTPLFQRGWTYQERLVPKRVIYFSKQELLWECYLDQRVAVRRSYEIVEEYSGLALTFQTDKLPAISAIAKQIQSLRPHDRYLAGLWSSTLVQDLLWAPRTIELTRPKTYCAPTWSWASFTGEVLYQVPKSPPIHG
ncbi:HET-domain-containing protein, partial [Lepidopterella palustris CBS 459.81]